MQINGITRGRSLEIATHGMALFLATLLAVSLWASPSLADDNDYPHKVPVADCNIGDCHSGYGGGSGPDASLGDISCLWCHDNDSSNGGLAAPLAVGHSSVTTSTQYGTWGTQCKFCHDPHLQEQYWAYGPESYFVSGISDADGVTENTLTMSGAGWEVDSLAGMVLFPNVEDYQSDSDWYNYGIIGNTADTITVKGPMNLAATGGGNKNFAVIYGQSINSWIDLNPDPYRSNWVGPVRFFRSEGANSFADGDATYDGICQVCHTKTSHHRKDGTAPAQSHFDGARCTTCHPHASGFKAVAFDHTAAGAVLEASNCMECHAGPDPVGDVHGNQCGLCHVASGGGGPLFEPYESTAPQGGVCTDCHRTSSHAELHTLSPASGTVVIFPDSAHDNAGWVGDRPYFDVTVDCTLCHATNLITIHGNDCATCHPAPRDTLDPWNGGCQQGGCHVSYHQDSINAHLPFESPVGTENDCNRCHDASWNVTQSSCLNCHAANGPEDLTPPATTSNALPEYDGPAKIGFSIIDNGKVGVGRTFYQLDNGTVTVAGKSLEIMAPGVHQLVFWSIDQSGNTESPPNTVSFTIYEDNTAPTTTSNAQTTYTQGGIITLTATDDGTRGVKTTYYRLNSGSTQSGTSVAIPATSGNYTLTFWSEDWAGNIETEKSVNFTVTINSGEGIIRLVWSYSDTDGSPCGGDPDADASWSIGLVGSNKVLKSGSAGCPNWSGVNDVAVSVNTKAYWVVIDWWDSGIEDYNQTRFSNVPVTTPGQIALRRY